MEELETGPITQFLRTVKYRECHGYQKYLTSYELHGENIDVLAPSQPAQEQC